MPRTLVHRGRAVLATSAAAAALLTCAGIASAGTVSQWNMDETSGSTMVDSVGGNDGTLHNVSLGQPGFLGKAYSFNGSDSVVTGPTGGGLNAGASPFWYGAHIKFADRPSAAVVDYDLMRKGLSGASGGFWKIEVFPSGAIHCSMGGSITSQSLTAGPDLSDNQWHSVYCLKDDTSERVIVDGKVAGTVAVALGAFGNTSVLAVGGKAEGGDQYHGLMDQATFGTGTTLVNSVPPTISGTPVPGTALSAGPGTWDGLPEIEYTYQWQRCSAAGSACSVITGATAKSYTPAAADLGSTLRAVVTAENPLDQRTATSAATAVVTSPATGTPPPPAGQSSPPAATPIGAAGTPVAGGGAPLPAPVVGAATQCSRLLSSSVLRKATLSGHKTMTLRFDAGTGAFAFRAPRRTIRSVSFKFDGKPIGSAHGGRLTKMVNVVTLAAGDHILRATVQPRHGQTRTQVIRFTVNAC
jgi:hypothetical protein